MAGIVSRMMTAGPDMHGEPAYGWWVHTDQGVILAGPFATEAEARAGGNVEAVELRARMRRARYPEADVRARVAALRVSYGMRGVPYGDFVALEQEPPGAPL